MSEEQNSVDSSDEQQPRKIKFDYIKSNFFRVIRVDGIWGGITPNADIQIAFWNERPAIPKQVVYEIMPDGDVIENIEGREAIVREVEVSMILDIDTAEMLIDWLRDQVLEIQGGIDDEGSGEQTHE